MGKKKKRCLCVMLLCREWFARVLHDQGASTDEFVSLFTSVCLLFHISLYYLQYLLLFVVTTAALFSAELFIYATVYVLSFLSLL